MDDNIAGEEYGPEEIEADFSVGLEVFNRGNCVPIIRLEVVDEYFNCAEDIFVFISGVFQSCEGISVCLKFSDTCQ